jgi:transcriptional regulator with XRE-family HTH domain
LYLESRFETPLFDDEYRKIIGELQVLIEGFILGLNWCCNFDCLNHLDGMDPMVESTYLYKNIRFLRKQMNLSQEELALKIGLNRGNIASYENGSAEPKVCNLLRISRLFGVSICDLAQRDLSGDSISSPDAYLKSGFRQQVKNQEQLDVIHSNAQRKLQMMEGLVTCSRLKLEQVHTQIPPELQLIIVNFEELYRTARSLMDEHLSLLKSLNSKDSSAQE